jgi:hypothetical protein
MGLSSPPPSLELSIPSSSKAPPEATHPPPQPPAAALDGGFIHVAVKKCHIIFNICLNYSKNYESFYICRLVYR